ncbi:MAG: hypothetical protein JSU92_00055 [Deltaproteobacteria bacterium]|nr:MAG: hypothetical protein JSU92_00055 [Deltaproteobacteria bacterium]
MKHIRKATKPAIFFSVIFLFSFFASACSGKTKSEDPGQTAVVENKAEGEKSLAQIIFITTSKACRCTMDRCGNGEQALTAAMYRHPDAPQVERLDHAREKDRVNQIIKKYQAVMLPIIFFIDKDGNLLDTLEGEFYEEDVNEILDQYAGVR